MEGEVQIDIDDPCSSYYDSDDNSLSLDSSAQSPDLILCDIQNSSEEDVNIQYENQTPEDIDDSLNRLQAEIRTQSQSSILKGSGLIFDPSVIDRYWDSDWIMEESWINLNEQRYTSTRSYSLDGQSSHVDGSDDRVWLVEDERNIRMAQSDMEEDDDGYDLIIEDVVSDDGELISRRITQITAEEMENKENVGVGRSSRAVSDVGEDDSDDRDSSTSR